MKLPNSRKIESQWIFLSPNEVFSIRNRLYLIELWAKGFNGNSQTIQAILKGTDGSQQSNDKALLVKITPT